MLYTIDPQTMQRLEQDYMRRTGVPGALLMEHAAQGVCQAIARHCTPGAHVLFLCGPGNNGGDGYAAARLWKRQGGQSTIIELTSQVHGDALMNRTLAEQCNIPFMSIADVSELPACGGIVDALFGTGLSRELDDDVALLIGMANQSGKPIIAVDIPSGLNGADGCVYNAVIHATETVTFHRPKTGLYLGAGASTTGRITVHDILIPADWSPVGHFNVLTPDDVARMIPPRPRDSHKGTFGKTVIFAGSVGMAGAAALCAKAAVKTGSGLTILLCRESILPILQTLCPAAVCVPLPEENGRLTAEAVHVAEKHLTTDAVAVIGCGLGQTDDLLPLIEAFRYAHCPVVWDADALNLLAQHPEMLPLPPYAQHYITPHPGEAARLLGQSVMKITSTNMLDTLYALHQTTGASVVLKCARTLIQTRGRTAVNPIGTPALSRGGSGDILSGMIGALLAQRERTTLHATCPEILQLACYLHAAAAIRAERRLGEYCVTPEDVIDNIRLDAGEME